MKDYLNNEADPILDPLIKSYYEANINLARTIAFKSDRTAIEQNKYLINNYNYPVNLQDKTTWKYYLNLAGEYHPLDKEMTIVSLDTLDKIVFNKETLAINPSTRHEYRFGTSYYKTLVSLYPDQEDLILGILIPCNINYAIEAEEGTILRYDSSLVEENEYSLIKDLETSIKGHMARWYIEGYSITDTYYLMSYFSLLFQFILTKLFNLRDSKRQTYEVHSFHVRMFLRGYFGLDQYYIYLNQKQALYLYRNLPRIVRFMGYDSTFQELLTNLLSPRNIQMLGYVIRQTNFINSDYTPLTVIQSEALNKTDSIPALQTLDPSQLFLKENTVLYGTKDYYDANSNKVKFLINHQEQAKVITKDVIIQSQAQVNIFSSNLDDFLFNHWGFMVSRGLYTGNVVFENPETGTNITLTAMDAFVYFYYLSISYIYQNLVSDLANMLKPEDQDMISNLASVIKPYKVLVIPRFLSQLHSSISSSLSLNSLASTVELQYRSELTPIAEAIFNAYVPLTAVNSPELFYNLCLNIYKGYINQNGLAITATNPVTRGYAKNMVLKLYQDSLVNIYPDNYLISDFLTRNNLKAYEDIGKFLPQLIVNLYQSGTGSAANIASDQVSINKALINIIKTITSYNIQYININEQNDSTTIPLEPVNINSVLIKDNAVIQNISAISPSVNIQSSTIIYN